MADEINNTVTQRTAILDSVTERIRAKFGPQGTEMALFREVWRRPWSIGNVTKPACTVVDQGAKRTGKNSDETKDTLLSFELWLDLEDDFGRQGVSADWTDRVARLVDCLQNWDPKRCVKRMDYVEDSPVEVVLSEAAMAQLWIVRFECQYFSGFTAFGDVK